MPARVLHLAPPDLAARFAAAGVRGPLSARQCEELDAVLERARAFEDLPGKWQAALLAAEAGRPSPGGGSCCGGG
jgi:hypothetical protein